jgi:chromosome segregation protein
LLLKSLSLVGFKSFADRTRLEFHSGVNVVVGPNGSGKSNLLDALAWVMGTQATSLLRTEKMDDVIFAGTATRPKLGRAEVTLTFDNRDRFLPLDLDEISMTRRLYRDGTSEYLLNGTQCRLLDLHEILADGGVGRHQHVLVGQGQIGDILNARPDEHRAVIEEAAGVTKHRGRRDRSIRRLEQTDIDVARLTDILEEQRRRLRPLKRQANAAERHDSVKASARALHLWIGGESLRSLAQRDAAAAAETADLTSRLESDVAELEGVAGGLDELRTAAGKVGRDLERDTAAAARLETLGERFQRIASVARERRRALEGRIAGTGQRRSDLEAERVELAEALRGGALDEQEARTRLASLESTLAALEDEERALSEQVGLSADGLVANLRGDLSALEAAAERDQRETAALELRRQVVAGKLESDAAERGALATAIEETDAGVGKAQASYEDSSSVRGAAQARWEQAEQVQQRALVDLARARARYEAIESALAGEGDPEARTRTAAANTVIGSVVERLDVPSDVAPAVDAALGQWRDAFVAEGVDGVAAVAAMLKSDGLGGVSLIATGAESADPAAAAVAAEWGVDALVDRLGSSADRPLANRLLGDVVLVEGWANGWELVRRYPDLRAATPEGDVIAANRMYLAQPDGVGPAALEAAAVGVEAATKDSTRADSAAAAARNAFDSSRERERSALEVLESLEARLAGHTEALALIDRAHTEHDAEMHRLQERHEALRRDAESRSERMEALSDRLGELEGEDEERQQAWEALKARREDVALRKIEARRLRDGGAADLAGVIERLRLQEARLTSIGAELDNLGSNPVDPLRLSHLEGVEARARRALAASRDHVSVLRDRQRVLREQATLADAELASALEQRTNLERGIAAAKERLSALAIESAEVEIRTEAAAEALRRDADATEEMALAAPQPEIDEDTTFEGALATVEARLRRMGPVNPLAAVEYQELAAEVELLETQLADLEETRQELRKVISALDDKMAALFMEAFDDIARMFEENFTLVFPGGRGRLVLTDPANPLDTGVEIHAQPLGKKVGRLSLLSGGERSLAALAFLFAVFRARPSPFYVLDEVEAALDDANLRRFLKLVDTLRRSAQLVIITHQQQTMEAADILYGVTMEPGESSLIVAKRLVESLV